MRRAVTFLELMVVVIIIAILAVMAMTQFSGPREQMVENEAKATLKLIASAQKIYRMEYQTYIKANNTTEVNDRLRMKLSSDSATAKWNYTVNSTGTGFVANATRINFPTAKKFYINESMENATLAP